MLREPDLPNFSEINAQPAEPGLVDMQLDQDLLPVELEQVVPPIDADPVKNENWLKRNMLKLSLGAFAVSSAATVVNSPLNGIEHKLIHAAPWVAGGLVGSETFWIGGAAMMVAATGRSIGNPFRLRSRMGEITKEATDSKLFKTGLAINTAGAVATAGIVSGGVMTSLPPESWGVLGFAAADLAMTVSIRRGIYKGIKQQHESGNARLDDESQQPSPSTEAHESEKKSIKVRHATLADIPRLAEIDLKRFRQAYGENVPPVEEVVDMLTRRFENAPDWMFVGEVDGVVEGFVAAFRTSSPIEKFVSWEESTAHGTLDNKVDPKGKYVYIVNMTLNPDLTELGGEDMLIANLFANGIRDGVEYGYFVSRMPQFRMWLNLKKKRGEVSSDLTDDQLTEVAESYVALTKQSNSGEVRYDYELRMYEQAGFTLERLVPDGFEDDASLNFGVVCKAIVPPTNKTLKAMKPLRMAMASGLRLVARNPKLLKKVI